MCKNSESSYYTTANTASAQIDNNDADEELNKIVQKFWEADGLQNTTESICWSEEQTECERIFSTMYKRNQDGRFVVKLPYKVDPAILGNSKEVAVKRFLNLEKRLNKDNELKLMYTKFLKEYEEAGHMKLLEQPSTRSCYFMPHQCVIRPEKSSTKLWVVFDASCKAANGLSLNDVLMVGPVVQNDLITTILRFRLHKYGLTADVSAMYRQIEVCSEDKPFQQIVWRSTSDTDLKVFQLQTVTYGKASAPFLATRCLLQLADETINELIEASAIVKNDFCVDDLISGGNSLEEIQQIKVQVNQILMKGQFQLRKWHSNHRHFLDNIPINDREKTLRVHDSDVIKTLGIIWDAEADSFKFTWAHNCFKNSSAITKRIVLSDLSKLFDPLGLINPIIVKAKIFMQELWLKGFDWDKLLPTELSDKWISFIQQLQQLKDIQIPRLVLSSDKNSEIHVHGFSDASMRAYGCCVYVRCEDTFGNIKVNLYSAKCKVAPIRIVRSLPCLELCAAQLLVQLVQKIRKALPMDSSRIHLWTDSVVVLDWIASHPSSWKTFVANRVSFIQEHTQNSKWNYIPSKQNPADIISRGASATELSSSIWFSGPEFLQKGKNSFTHCKKNPLRHERRSTQLSSAEIDSAFITIVSLIQHAEYGKDIECLLQNKELSSSSSIKGLNPFIEKFNKTTLLRVGGRLKNSRLPYAAKCPLLLPKNNQFVRSYITDLHTRNFHAGAQALTSLLNERFSIVGAREYTRKIVRQCLHCFRYRPRLLTQFMGDLPEDRVNSAKPFSNSGVDFCGPIVTTYNKRGKSNYKSYLAVFICFATRAVHLEVVSDLTADAFIAALKRFIGRRGKCNRLNCDNATNFVGAKRLLKEFREAFLSQQYQMGLATWCAGNDIAFLHIPPRSPHFGGIWEAGFKSAKSHLYKTFQSAVLTFEELSTVAAQIEGILNSRPITPLSCDPNDERALTPAHFLNQCNTKCLVEPDVLNSNLKYQKRWHQISALQQHFWNRWRKEYLVTLQQRNKWRQNQSNLTVGSLVLIHEDNLPPQRWLLGRVIQVISGNDGKVRVADVRTQAGTFRRSIVKLAVIPQDN